MTDNQFPSRIQKSPVKNYTLVLNGSAQRRVTPSVYTQEMLQSTTECLAKTTEVHLPRILELLDISNTTHHKMSVVEVDQPLFQPYPSKLVFQNFIPAETYKLQLHLLNKDKVSRQVKLELQDAECFHVVGPKDLRGNVAPGMSAVFTVCFTPIKNKDYHHRLVFATERERFEVPVHAIGPRAILEFQDELHLPICPVKSFTEKTHLVRNIGNSMANFTLHTERPFSVMPSSGSLDVGETMQVTVTFNPMTIGDHSQDLILHYHSGEDVYISLHGACVELNIQLEPDSVLLTKTYISLATAHTVSLTNRSDVPLHYCWTTWPCLQEEAMRESSMLQQTEEDEREQLLLQCESNLTEIHNLPLMPGTLQERRSQVIQDHHLEFSNSCITIEPAEGEIWPNTTAQFVIVFKPEKAKLYQQTIYCDVTGCQSVLPLTLKGEGMGPKLQPNYTLMDMKNVFIGDKDNYELQLFNSGLVDAPFRLSIPNTPYGHCFSVSPQEGMVSPETCQVVEVTFQSHTLGTFSEDLLLTVRGQPESHTLTFRGCVIGPTFHFNVSELSFGDVGFGFPRIVTCSLFNTSYVPLNFALRVLGDGFNSPSLNWNKQLSDVSMDSWQARATQDLHAQPAEFTINPAAGSVPSMSDVTIKVTICANTVRRFRLALVVDVEGVGEAVMTLPISARCFIPEIVVKTPVLDFQKCFLNHTYEQKVCLINNSNVPACYGILDQEYEDNLPLSCGSSSPIGVICPQSSEKIPVFLLAKAIGPLHHTLLIAVCGSIQPPLEVVLSCIGQGPVVHVQSQQLDFGKIQVLTDSFKSLHLSNQSPIPACFTTNMHCRKSCWRIDPSEGEIPPKSQVELRVIAHLKDTVHFEDTLKVSIQHSETHNVALSATGTGTTIVSDRPFGPSLDLGMHFSPGSCQFHFRLTNQGQQTHRLYWQTGGPTSSTQTSKGENLPGQTIFPPISAPKSKENRRHSSLPSSTRGKPIFRISPSRVELFPGSSIDMLLVGSSDSPLVAREHLICRAIVGGQSSLEHIMSIDVTCRFVATVLSISPKQLNFYTKKVPGNNEIPLYEKIILRNVSSLTLSMELSVVEPFYLCEAPAAHSSAPTKSIVLGNNSQAELWVCFNPIYCLDRVSQIVDEFLEVHYQGHPQHDMVKLHAEVHFPNLHFSSTTVDFGCVLNYTETCRQILMTNSSPLPVYYCWAFQDDQQHSTGRETVLMEGEREQSNPKKAEGFSSRAAPSLNRGPSKDEENNTQSTVQVFDIWPNHGHLQPGDKQQVTISFYGQENVCKEVVAQCHVEEGPIYKIKLKGEASTISYSIDPTHVDFGLQLFEHEGEAEVTVKNNGKVGFKFIIASPQKKDEAENERWIQTKALEESRQQSDGWQQKDYEQNGKGQEVRPGLPTVIPSIGFIEAGAEQHLRVLYLPGIPEVYEKHIQLQVAFLSPQDITLKGEGVFPRIRLNLPQKISNKCYSDVVQLAKTAIEKDGVSEERMNEVTRHEGATAGACMLTYEELLCMEIKKTLVKENVLASNGILLQSRGSLDFRNWHKFSKLLLLEYVLDFGYVIPCQVVSHSVNVTNNGPVAVSFHANLKPLASTGFRVDIERVKDLPCGETSSFTVKFDPQEANLNTGSISVVLPIQVKYGPMVHVQLCAVLTTPTITVSTDTLQFDTVQCGMCQMKTIQLFNHEPVPCSWSIIEEVKILKKVDKFLHLYQHKNILKKQQQPPVVFEMIPSSGTLSPGEQVNVLIKFSPAKGVAYSKQLVVHVVESTKQVLLTAFGQGEEPQLEFCPPLLVLGPCLPVSTEVEAEVIVKNPCSFPIEFYSLELDKQYLEEEKILRLMQGYDEKNNLLLPPRAPGESLPKELLEYYQEYCSQVKNDAELKTSFDEKEVGMGDTHEEGSRSKDIISHPSNSKDKEKHTINLISKLTKEGSSGKLGQLETTPVSRAIAHHMCVDLSPEGLAAHKRRGISIILYGAPLTDKSSAAAALACHYGGVCLTIDAVVTDVLMHGTSPVSLTTRQLYDYAAAQYIEKWAAEPAQASEASVEDLKVSAPASNDIVDHLAKSNDDSKASQETENTHFALCSGGDVTILRNLLPEQLLVEILVERFQQRDCRHAIVIDGLESVYTQSVAQTLQLILKALNIRKHIYVVNLSDSYVAMKAQKREQKETKEALQKEKVEKEEQWLQDLDEEEYDALPEEEKERIIQQHREKLRQKKLRELERKVKEKEEREHQEEIKRNREEELKKNKKKGGKKDLKEVSRKKSFPEGKQSADVLRMSSPNNSKECLVGEQHHLNEVNHSKEGEYSSEQPGETKALCPESPQPKDKLEREKDPVALDDHPTVPCSPSKDSLQDPREQHHLNESTSKCITVPQNEDAPHSNEKTGEDKGLQSPQPAYKGAMSSRDDVFSQFTAYELSQEQVEHILQHWDRAQGLLMVPLPSAEASPMSEDTTTIKLSPATKRSKKTNYKSPTPIQMAAPVGEDKLSPQDNIPHIVLNATGNGYPNIRELLKDALPSMDQVLDDLGMGPSGPPIPPPTTFSIVNFPIKRLESRSNLTCDNFTLLVPSSEQGGEKKDSEEAIQSPPVKEAATPSKNIKGSSKERAVTKDHESQKNKRRPLPLRVSSKSDCAEITQDQHQATLELKRNQSLTTFRWVVPANGEVVLRIWFFSDSPGTFEQTFNFELLGTQRYYQLLCRGICTYPSICKNHMTLFALSKKVPLMQEGIQKTYITKPGYFEFGPLHCGKSRDRYKENRYPENTEKLVICNNSGLDAEVQFSFKHDAQATTYLLDPPAMTLKPDQKQELTVWAYPTKLGQVKDSIVCHIKDNPELVIIDISCLGVRPELKLESKHLHFDRILLHRQDSRSLMLHNKTPLPVSWRLQGVEELGDEFIVPQEEGNISSDSSFPLSFYFRARRPLHIKKILRLEVSDVDKILGIVHTENIHVTAEAYDIALDISPDGCLDFGTIRVFEESKLSLRMKNQGKYEIAYKFTFQQTKPSQPNLDSIFRVSCQNGTLIPRDKPTIVQIICRPNTEVFIREQPVLSCQVIEPNIGIRGEAIAMLSIKVSVKSVFSRYTITPECDINFGPLAHGCKKNQSFTIQNKGDFDTRFTISHMITDSAPTGRSGCSIKKVPLMNHSEKATGAISKVKCEMQNSLTMGVFSVAPCTGILQPGSQQVVTVNCVAEQLGKWNQGLLIDISDRDPSDQPNGISYRLLAEVCKPGIAFDLASIFEEHHLCFHSSQLSSEQFCNAEGIYIQEENKFIFNKVLVGQTARASFKLINNGKVPCTLSLAVRQAGTKNIRNMEAFDLATPTLSIPCYSHSFAVVTFTPPAMQLYSVVFEATIITPTFKDKVLGFEIMGEGNLPSVRVIHPALSRGESPMLLFKRVLPGHRRTRVLVLLNDGNVPAQVHVDLLDVHRVFTLKAAPGNICKSIHFTQLEGTIDTEHKLVHRASLRLNVDEQAEFEVSFCSDKPLSVKAKMLLQVNGTCSNTSHQVIPIVIQVTGEAYQEIISLHNIRRSLQSIEDDDNGVLNFGYCHVDCHYEESFTMTNHSSSQVVRFEWPPTGPHVCFSPQVGHLHAGCSKEVTVTFCSSQPVTLTHQPIRCKLAQITFQQPQVQVADWDEQQGAVHWLSSSKQASAVPRQHAQRKVIKTDPEPCCSLVESSEWELELHFSAVCDYMKFSCNTDNIYFKDTMLFQTRRHHLQIENHSKIKLEFSFKVEMDPSNDTHTDDQRDNTCRPGSGSAVLLGARPASALVSGMLSSLVKNPDLSPFSVDPSIGAIEPGAMQDFIVCFSPVKVAQFEGKLVCSISNLQDGNQAPCISVCGHSLLPHCHFDLADSDYISAISCNPEFTVPLNSDTRVIEFKAVGFSLPSTRRFSVTNPTSKPYSFKWKCDDTGSSPFSCLTPFGTILPGKKVEVCFQYISEQMDTVESFWSFVIETLPLSVPFLCVGTTRQPLVYLDRPHLDFGEVLVGRKMEETVDLVNGEEEPFQFSLMQSSLLCDDQHCNLILQPMTGTVAPKDRLPLSVSFIPRREGFVRFKLLVRLKRMSEPLALLVKADCFTMSTLVQIEMPGGELREVDPNHNDVLDFGKVEISNQSILNFLVTNLARVALEVNFDLTGPSELLQYFEVKPQSATTEIGRQLQSSLFFCPRRICNVKDITLSIRVKLGPTYNFSIKGRSVAPRLVFSFTKYNFGKHFLYSPGMMPASQTLVISNKGEKDISVQCDFRNTSYLEMDFQTVTLPPGAVLEIPIKFYPCDVRHYSKKLTFVVNSTVATQVDILGQGIEMKLEVDDPRQRKVKLGCVMLGQKVKKKVVLVNHSLLDLSFTLLLNSKTQLDPRDLSFSPLGELSLKARGGSCNVEIQFSPRQHIPCFTAELQADIAGLLHPLVIIQGICQGVEVQLDQDHLAFGAVVQCCQARKRIVMINTGGIGARFEWKTSNFPPDLSISPVKGYISPGTEVPFEVTFAPMELSDNTRYENVSCCVESNSSALTLTVTGSCITAATSKEVVNFVCPVHDCHTQILQITNPTNQHCNVRPVIKGREWSAAYSVILKPLQNETYEITYRPLTMTSDGKKHLGSVFFSFPDGTGLLYSFQGTAEPPKAEDTIINQLPAKTQHTHVLPVHNWLSKQQRFRVLIEILKPDKPDASVSVKGLEYFDVPALAKREYELSFFACREGQYNTKVTFCNLLSGEYLFYLLNFKVTSPEVLSTINVVATVRRLVSASVQVENPLTTATCLTIDCKCPEISAPPQHIVPGQSKGSLRFQYQPLHAGNSTAQLTLYNSDLGYFHYDLLLKAQPPLPEKTVHFNTSLGCSHYVLVKFINYSHIKTTYSCMTDCTAFSVDKNVCASPGFHVGSEGTVEVCFEPHQLGEVRGQLSLYSEIGGEYIFPLHGMCLPPKAQGPFSIKAGRRIAIPFKNIFLQTTTFHFQVDNPSFTVKDVDPIPSKKTQKITISFEAPQECSPGPWFGKLTITSQRSESQSKPCSWVYYLKGYLAELS